MSHEPLPTSIDFMPQADNTLGSPFWNAILHRKLEEKPEYARRAWWALFWAFDILLVLCANLWLRGRRKRMRK